MRLWLLTLLLLTQTAWAELGSIRIEGRPSVTVAKARITIADIADVYSSNSADDDAIIALRSIRLGSSPAPGQCIEVSATEILKALEAAQVDLQKVGYKLPRSVVITRAARTLGEAELKASIEQTFSALGREVIVHSVDVEDPFMVEPGPISLEAALLPSQARNRASMLITARGESTETKGKVVAAIEEWRDVPVAARSLGRGSIISPSDISMARLQTHLIPSDASTKAGTLVGLALQAGIAAGEPFSNQKLIVPPVITTGSKVTMVVRSGGLEATASGIAMESGAMDQRINIRNEASKKIVTGRVLEPGLVLIEESGR